MNFNAPLGRFFFTLLEGRDQWSQLTLKLLHDSEFSYSKDT
ncbi:hypothetical protein ALQ18_02428 [Pseudomonas marginalis pv. marginalis]|nr:hypothetical protein ALQ18_02428 [Pseudomonas marginalis pv. marginalis]